jgi:hypothetical protein
MIHGTAMAALWAQGCPGSGRSAYRPATRLSREVLRGGRLKEIVLRALHAAWVVVGGEGFL